MPNDVGKKPNAHKRRRWLRCHSPILKTRSLLSPDSGSSCFTIDAQGPSERIARRLKSSTRRYPTTLANMTLSFAFRLEGSALTCSSAWRSALDALSYALRQSGQCKRHSSYGAGVGVRGVADNSIVVMVSNRVKNAKSRTVLSGELASSGVCLHLFGPRVSPDHLSEVFRKSITKARFHENRRGIQDRQDWGMSLCDIR